MSTNGEPLGGLPDGWARLADAPLYGGEMNWTHDKPTAPGMYLFKCNRYWPYRLAIVTNGSWRIRQNPEELYVSGLFNNGGLEYQDGPLATVGLGMWLGPLPTVPDAEGKA